MGDYKAIGKAFIEFYYNKFDVGPREAVASLYVKPNQLRNFYSQYKLISSCFLFSKEPVNGMMSFNRDDFAKGAQEIAEKLRSLTFQTIQHNISTMDIQPTTDSGILIVVTGALKVSPMTFYFDSQLFVDVFRLTMINPCNSPKHFI